MYNQMMYPSLYVVQPIKKIYSPRKSSLFFFAYVHAAEYYWEKKIM